MTANDQKHRAMLQSIAHQAMLDRGLLPDFSAATLAELGQLPIPAAPAGKIVRDLRNLVWASIDNDDSLDLDQLTVAEAMPGSKSWWPSPTTLVRLLAIPIEGKLVRGFEGTDVGQRLRVQLLSVDVGRGFIDLAKIS
jgi:hypothetical protein